MTVRTVYLIRHKDSEFGKDVYVGSTSLPLGRKLSLHKSISERRNKNRAGRKLYKRMREVGLENWEIKPLLTAEENISSRADIRKLKKMSRDILNADLNKIFRPKKNLENSGL